MNEIVLIAWSTWADGKRWRNVLIGAYAALLFAGTFVFLPFSIPVLPPQQWLAYAQKLHFKPQDSENHDATILPQFYADRFGWHELVHHVAQIYDALPPQQRAVTGIFAGNYGQASAINILGKPHGLPTAISGHQNYWIWGPQGYTGQEMIVVNEEPLAEMQQAQISEEEAEDADMAIDGEFEDECPLSQARVQELPAHRRTPIQPKC